MVGVSLAFCWRFVGAHTTGRKRTYCADPYKRLLWRFAGANEAVQSAIPSAMRSVGNAVGEIRTAIVVWAVVRRNCAAWLWWFVSANVVGGAVGDAIGDAVGWKCSRRDKNGDRGVVMVCAVVKRNCAA